MDTMRSLVLIGHGSHLNPDSAQAVYHYAELIRQAGVFSEVIEGYWKEEPSLRQVLRTTRYSDVTVIPMFISEGYFTETVIPRELNLGHSGPVPVQGITRQLGGKTVRYTLPYGVHPRMADVILARAQEAFPEFNPEDTGLLIIGHGTTRNQNSNRVIYQNRDRIRERGLFKEVHALFLDEDPKVDTWETLFTTRNVIMVPFFTAEGWHTRETIPEDLGLTGPVTEFENHTVHYGLPVGTHPMVTDVILDMARDAWHNTSASGEPSPEQEAAWETFLNLARQGMRLGEVLIRQDVGLFTLQHMLDEGKDQLQVFVAPESIRDLVRLSDAGEYRPVHTFRNLPRGWKGVFNEADFRRAISYVYPSVMEDTYLYQKGALRVTPWISTARRQTGIYARVQQATLKDVDVVSKKICGFCLKSRLWYGEQLYQTFLDGVPGNIPCVEACTYVISEVREHVAQKASKTTSSGAV